MKRSDWIKVGIFVVSLFVASGIPAAVHVGAMNAEIKEARTRAVAAETMILSTRQRFDESNDAMWRELREINTRLSRIEGFLKH